MRITSSGASLAIAILLLSGCSGSAEAESPLSALEQSCSLQGELLTRHLDAVHEQDADDASAAELIAVESEIVQRWSERSEREGDAAAPIFKELSLSGAGGNFLENPRLSRALDVLAGLCEYSGFPVELRPAAGG